jgi:DNA-binding GntR family transcriptional regulator
MTMPSSARPAPGVLEPLQLRSTPALIADQLRSQILEGRFPPHTQLAEVELARQLQVSRGPIREAMQRLIQEGLLHAERNRGVFVVELGLDDARDVYLARGVIERAAAAIVVKEQPEDALDELQEIVDRLGSSVGGVWTEVIRHDLAFHQTLVEAAGSERLNRMFRTLIAETRLCLIRLEPFYQDANEVVDEHQAITEALRRGDRRRADSLLKTHMQASAARLSAPEPAPDGEGV